MSLRDDLKAYIDGELEPRRNDEIRIALETDAALQREYIELRALSASFANVSQVETSGLESTLKLLDDSRRVARVQWRRIAWAGGLVLATTLVAMVVFPIMSTGHLMAKNDSASSAEEKVMDSAAGGESMMAKSLQKNPNSMMKAPSVSASAASPALRQGEPEVNEYRPPTRSKDKGRVAATEFGRKKIGTRLSHHVPNPPSDQLAMLAKKPHSIVTFRSPKTVVGSRETGTTMFAQENHQTVFLAFDSRESGEKQVLDLVGKYEIKVDQLSGAAKNIPSDQTTRTIVIDVPDEIADKTVDELRKLPIQIRTNLSAQNGNIFGATTSASSARGQGPGGGAGAMGGSSFGGAKRSSGGFGGGAGGFNGGLNRAVAAPVSPSGKPREPVKQLEPLTNSMAESSRPKLRDMEPFKVQSSNAVAKNGSDHLIDNHRHRGRAKPPQTTLDNVNSTDRKLAPVMLQPRKTRRIVIVVSEKPKLPPPPVP